ncbi:MAG: hypothetical protein ACE1ZA_03535, partial [Pseudomonadales bacterium]
FGMAAHRNRLKDNVIEDNGTKGEAAGIRIRGETDGLVLEGNTIRDTREGASQTQKTGVLIEQHVRSVTLRDNQIQATKAVDDQREKKPTVAPRKE